MVTRLGLAPSSGPLPVGRREVCGFLITFQRSNGPLITFSLRVVTGTPPSFTAEPEDMVVFAMNADMSRASLTLYCNTSGDPSPAIIWYRNGARLTTNQRVTVNANGTLRIVNITEGMDATRAGRSYHCTAMNTFGTIRSRTAIISYACELKEEICMSPLYDVCSVICFRF